MDPDHGREGGPEGAGTVKNGRRRGRTGTGAGRGDGSRIAILQTARELFARRGFRGTSLASIADAVELSQPGVLHHFPSKTELLLAVLRQRDTEDGRLASSLRTREGIDLIRALGGLVAHNQASPEIVRFFTVLTSEALADDHPAHDYFVDRYRQIRARIERNLRRGQESGEVRCDADLEAIAPIVVAVMDGLQLQWLLDRDVDVLRSYDVFARMLIQYLEQGSAAEL